MYSGYQMPHATTERGQNSLPLPEFNNNDPFHPVPGSMVGPSLVPSIPPYSNQTYTCAYPIQPTYVNHGNANFGLWQEGPGFRPYVFNAESRIEGTDVGDIVTQRLLPRDSSSQAPTNLSELVESSKVANESQTSPTVLQSQTSGMQSQTVPI